MPAVQTTGSTNIALLDSRIYANQCDGKFYVDLSPSIYIGDGDENVLGANVQIKNPYGVIVKPYGSNYEIAPNLSGAMDAVVSFNIPTQAGNYQYGLYTIDVQLFDEDGSSWTVTKTVKLCEPDKNNKTRKYGSLSALLKADCKNGKLHVIVDSVPTYNGQLVESQDNEFELEYPTSSGLDPLETTYGSFSVQLFEGVYKITGTICAEYNFGDNVYVNVLYKIKKEKNVRCLIDECCVLAQLVVLQGKLDTDCSDEEKATTSSTILETLSLLKMAQISADCGEDPSEWVEKLEELLGCTCTCNCAEGTPIINNEPTGNFDIEGCNVTKETVGLTTVFTINNYEYVIAVAENGGALVVSSPQLADCTKTQTITFNIATVYAQIKALANQNSTEADFWSSVINKSLAGIPPDCLDVSQGTWDGWTFKQKITAIIAALCENTGCEAAVSDVTTEADGDDIIISWTNNDDVFTIDIYVDGIYVATVAPGLSNPAIDEYRLEGYADGVEHVYTLVPKCANGSIGTMRTGDFFEVGCPDIAPPVVSSNNVNGVDCPYDLTSLESEPPIGIEYEWHTANNTSASSLVADPTNVSSGVYYAFAKDGNGCYSESTKVTLVCDEGTSCTAPQNLTVRSFGSEPGRVNIIEFQSAAYPPPGNSYTVLRKAAADPDIPASYTTIGTPAWNATTSRWTIVDADVDRNTLYTYKAQSNCADSPATTPYVLKNYADLNCIGVDVTPDIDSADYSFDTTDFNDIDKVVVKLYDETGTILIHSDTHLALFSDPTTGTFFYLEESTNYNIRVDLYIGTYSKVNCPFTPFTTGAP